MMNHAQNKNGKPRIDEVRPALRLALYSHDAMGVGHVRRNLLIGQTLSKPPYNATSLLVCGVQEVGAFGCGNGIDCLTLPSLDKHANDDYRPRNLRMSRTELATVRKNTLHSALLALAPDLLIVDKVPRGIHRELEEVLPALRKTGRTKIVFGMRDILDTPMNVAAEWKKHDYEKFIVDNYDAVWVYGDPNVYDPIAEYGFRSLRPIARYTGYFDQTARLQYAPRNAVNNLAGLDLTNTILCMVGGGQDGVELANAFARAEFPAGLQGLLVTGPLMASEPRQALHDFAKQHPRLHVVTSVPDADVLVDRVQRVICMGGYNSLMSVVSFGRPSLIVPRTVPRQEQQIRAERFAKLGFVDTLLPDQLSPASISKWLAAPTPQPSDRNTIDFGGLDALPTLIAELGVMPETTAPKSHWNSMTHQSA